MLLEFRMKNFKSFVEEAVFAMEPAPKQTGLDYSLLKDKVNKKTIKGLCASVIYGPNAAGKTNIIGAMEVMRNIVMNGNIKNSNDKNSPNAAVWMLELIPNNKLTVPEPVELSIDFFEKGFRIQYKLVIDLGLFLDANYKRRILSEELFVNTINVFKRDNSITLSNLDVIKEYLSDSTRLTSLSAAEIAQSSLEQEELFLTNGFKLIYSPSFAKLITDWFTNKFMVIYRADSVKVQPINETVDARERTVLVESTIDKAAKLFGDNSNNIGYIFTNEESEPKLCSILKSNRDKKNVFMSAEAFESYGTIRFVNLLPLVLRVLQTGGTLIVDEFDASIHPMALMSIVNIFHNDDVNINHAQLIFNTHNPAFLNSNLFRRDEIKFVERDDESHLSTLYSLSDFGTVGKRGVRKHEDYMKNYFINQYGAIKDIDFTSLILAAITKSNEE